MLSPKPPVALTTLRRSVGKGWNLSAQKLLACLHTGRTLQAPELLQHLQVQFNVMEQVSPALCLSKLKP